MADAVAKPDRTISLVRSPAKDGVGVFRITVDRRVNFYAFHEIRCEIGGRGFAVHRLGLGMLYHVRVGSPVDCSCDCIGFLSRDSCRHVLGLRALCTQGLL